MKKVPAVLLLVLINFVCNAQKTTKISLAGTWQVRLDSLNVGELGGWPKNKFTGENISLPGTLDDANIGTPNTLQPALNNLVLSNLARKHQYIGIAYYQREINIPSAWKNQKKSLSLERIIWKSTVYVDGNKIGENESLIGTHEYDLSKITVGKHLLTIAINNGDIYPYINVGSDKYPDPINQEMAHAYTNHTQIKWNGIIGEMSLKANTINAPYNLQIKTNLEKNSIKISFDQTKPSSSNISYEIIDATGKVVDKGKLNETKISGNKISAEVIKPDNMELWDEFNPGLYDLKIITSEGQLTSRFGFKEIKNKDGVLTLNNKRIFLRGNLECVIFPLTGHPPMQKQEWAKLIKQAKNYGLNHLRFHSWCPPKAAFEAADEAGFYFQVELPHWSLEVGKDPSTTAFLKKEARKILLDYGNHPSFIMFSMGNELQGDINTLNNMVKELKEIDNSRLYTTTTYSFQKPMGLVPQPQDDFFVTQKTDKGWVRGQGIFNDKAPHFNSDYSANSSHINVPLLTHEIGQYSVYPDISEIPKYTGVLQPLNFIAIRNDLEQKGLLERANEFTLASGKLAALLYKEEIERALKTPDIDGFQLLQLQDFPGQGTALVGLLNAFWESKGAISAENFRKFNSELVPLIRFEKAVYENNETFKASIEIANFWKEIKNQNIDWTVNDNSGKTIKSGTIKNTNLIIGNNQNLGEIAFLIDFPEAKQITINVSLENTDFQNEWNIWTYPKNIVPAQNVIVTSNLQAAQTALSLGKKVLFSPNINDIKGVKGQFTPVFWSPVHFPDQPGTMGLLVNLKHPALRIFPTEEHSDWQWWDLTMKSKSVITDKLEVTPIIKTIDNFVTNHHLANVFEVKVGKGQLIFSAIDITSDLETRPTARQLRNSLLKYMESEDFHPNQAISSGQLTNLLINK